MVTRQRAVGTFTVQMKPHGESSAVPEGASPLGRMSLDVVSQDVVPAEAKARDGRLMSDG